MVDKIKTALISKWGFMSGEEDAQTNGTPTYTESTVRFNYIFNPAPSERISEIVGHFGFVMPCDLNELYSECNGMRLFLSSLNIYGSQTRRYDMEPFDLMTENYNIHARMKKNRCDIEDLFFFGSCGKDCVFAYNTKMPDKILCLEKGSDRQILSFANLNELFNFFLPRMMEQYDCNCMKKAPNEEFEDVPVLANALISVEEIL